MLKNGRRCRRGVRVGCGHQHVLNWQAGLLVYHAFGFIKYFPGKHATIHDGNRESGLSVIERQTARVQFIVDVFDQNVLHAAIDRKAKPGSDIAGGRAGAKLSWRFCGNRGLWIEDRAESRQTINRFQAPDGVHGTLAKLAARGRQA